MRRNDNQKKGNVVYAKEGENFNSLMRRFKKKVQEDKILETLREKEFYEKPTTQRKKAKAAAKARWRKQLREQQLPKKMY